MEFHELQQIVESNSRTIRAMLDLRETDRLKHEEFKDYLRTTISDLKSIQLRQEDLMERINRTNEGVVRLISSLDDDRPTVLRKLNSIEKKLDQLLPPKSER